MKKRLFALAMGSWVIFHLIASWNTLQYLLVNSFFIDGALLVRSFRWTDYVILACYLAAVAAVDWLLLRMRWKRAARKIKWYWLLSLLTGAACLFLTELMDSLGLAGYAVIALTPALPLYPLIGPVTWVLAAGFPVMNLLFCWWVQRRD